MEFFCAASIFLGNLVKGSKLLYFFIMDFFDNIKKALFACESPA